jgi:hypothetical protein
MRSATRLSQIYAPAMRDEYRAKLQLIAGPGWPPNESRAMSACEFGYAMSRATASKLEEIDGIGAHDLARGFVADGVDDPLDR